MIKLPTGKHNQDLIVMNTHGTGASTGCYWERTTDDSGDYDSIIANADLNPGALASVTLKSGDFFSSDSCGTWTRV